MPPTSLPPIRWFCIGLAAAVLSCSPPSTDGTNTQREQPQEPVEDASQPDASTAHDPENIPPPCTRVGTQQAAPLPEPFVPAVPTILRPGVPIDSTQALVVTTDSWAAQRGLLRRYLRENGAGAWVRVDEDPVPVSVGRRGLAWGRGLHPEQQKGRIKREGDHRSPAGVFDLGEARGYASEAPPDTSWPFQHSGRLFRCMDDPRSKDYNSFISVEGMYMPQRSGMASREVVFELMLFVKHNTNPVKRGAGSCVFLHVWAKPDLPTQGCVVMSRDFLAQILAWLRPDRRPVLVLLPAAQHQQHEVPWSLPPFESALAE